MTSIAVGLAVISGADRIAVLTDVRCRPRRVGAPAATLPTSPSPRHPRRPHRAAGHGARRACGPSCAPRRAGRYNGIETHIAGARHPGVITRASRARETCHRSKRRRQVRRNGSRKDQRISGPVADVATLERHQPPRRDSIRDGASLFASGSRRWTATSPGGGRHRGHQPRTGRLGDRQGVPKVSRR